MFSLKPTVRPGVAPLAPSIAGVQPQRNRMYSHKVFSSGLIQNWYQMIKRSGVHRAPVPRCPLQPVRSMLQLSISIEGPADHSR